jgi:hypothetical protein
MTTMKSEKQPAGQPDPSPSTTRTSHLPAPILLPLVLSHPAPEDESDEEEYYVIPLLPLIFPSEEGTIHNDSGFCHDPTCPCHRDKELVDELNKRVQNGLATPEDATRIYQGKTLF